MVKVDKSDWVTVYHGTTYWNALQIAALSPGGLKAAPWRTNVYVTTDRSRAVKYAEAWTAAYLQRNFYDGGKTPSDDDFRGGLVEFKVPPEMLVGDPYSPDEPAQFMVRGRLPKKYVVDWEAPDFHRLADENVRLRNYTYWLGILTPDEGVELPRRRPTSGVRVRSHRRRSR